MSRCPKTPGCLMHAGHDDECGALRDVPPLLIAVAKRQGTRLANWAAAKVLRAIGHEVKL